MARRKTHAPHENHERWLVSYADFITLLFAFFVVMFASSQTDKGKAQQVSEAVKQALENGKFAAAIAGILGGAPGDKGKGNAMFKGPGGVEKAKPEPVHIAELTPALMELNRDLQSEIDAGKLEVHLEQRGLVVSLRQAAFFPSGDDAINENARPTLQKVAQTIQKLRNPLRLEGHTDARPIRTARFRSNWELSAARSIAMMELLATEFGIPRERMAIAGYAETVPVDTNDTEEGRARNRRVDVVILSQQGFVRDPAASSQRASARPAHAPKAH